MTTAKTDPQRSRAESALSIALAVLMLLQSVSGRLFPGAYRDVAWIKATWLGNDFVTMLVVVPLLVASLVFLRRGSHRARLVWLGTLGYGAYNYAYYLLGAALNAFFPLYVFAFLIAVAALIVGLAGSDISSLASGFSRRTPVRAIGGFYVFVATGLSIVWFGMWAAYIFAGRPTPVETEAFKLVAALDTTIIVPALALGGVLLWSRTGWGYVIAPAAGTLASLYLLVLFLNSGVAVMRGAVEGPGELPLWGTLLLLTTGATLMLLKAAGSVGTASFRLRAEKQ